MVLACKKWFPLVPGSLLAVLLGTAASVTFGLQDRGRDRRRDRFRSAGFRFAGRRWTLVLPRSRRPGGRCADRGVRRGTRCSENLCSQGRVPDLGQPGAGRPRRRQPGIGAVRRDGGQQKPVQDRCERCRRSPVPGQWAGGGSTDVDHSAASHRPFRGVAGSDLVGGGDRGRDRARRLPGAAPALPGVDRSAGQHLRFRRRTRRISPPRSPRCSAC